MAPCGNPPPYGRVSAGAPSRIKIGTLKGTPDFFLDGSAAARERGKNKFTICKYYLDKTGRNSYNYYQKQGVMPERTPAVIREGV
ncbi:hypothetical protein C3T75_24615 [Salmonella enterica]|nr:hypothetical protein [Salmonella enterica]ECS8300495.1 hypothetical protein [Salmonella enterica]